MKLFLWIASILLALVSSPVNAFSFQAWNQPKFAGITENPITTMGHKQLGFWANSYEWLSPPGDGCCVRFCSAKKSIGYWCETKVQPKSSAGFDSVIIGCGEEKIMCN